ncbi:MAG TPA: ClpXP protease specificity-enhancing factor SspB [Caulobacteraceae bacterium]|nr:ClpXP protease specificity-enhancing factor SspB [Caulobacteraceae bacterium]
MANGGGPLDQIGYDALQQEALRGVVRAALKHAASRGLPGDHHFYISFKTQAPGVTGPKELLSQYPDEMMIVLQHQYWDLAPGETFFSVTLKFGGKPNSLSIPYAAITEFRDPSVEYRLVFAVPEFADEPAAIAGPTPSEPGVAATPKVKPDGPNIVSLDQFRKK